MSDKCLVTREDGKIVSVSAALPPEDLKELKEMHKIAGSSEPDFQTVPVETGRQLKRNMV